ncbi:hypothetical protein GCM10027592_56620 [Spirosoma flavus]
MNSQPIQSDEDDYTQIRDELFIPYRPAIQKQRSNDQQVKIIEQTADQSQKRGSNWPEYPAAPDHHTPAKEGDIA